MNRQHLTDQVRRIRATENRDPVENALYALVALSRNDRSEVFKRFNAIFEKTPSVPLVCERVRELDLTVISNALPSGVDDIGPYHDL